MATLFVTGGNDSLVGTHLADTLSGFRGNDSNEYIYGGSGNAELIGGAQAPPRHR